MDERNHGDMPAPQLEIGAAGHPPSVHRVGKYRIISELGREGASTVYLAFARGQSGVNKLVVLKALPVDAADDASTELRFLDEARVAVQLNHANVVQTYEASVEGDRHVVVMEYLEGHTLDQVVRRAKLRERPFPLATHLYVIISALEGIHYAHEFKSYDGRPLHLVHRTVSPQNIFLTYDGQVKVLDFGIAKIAGAFAETQLGSIKGKIANMAPEQVRSDFVDRRADVFSIGCMLWTIATGTKLWKDTPEIQIIRHLGRGEVPRINGVSPRCDLDLARIVNKAIAADTALRYATALELQSELQEYCAKRFLVSNQKELGLYVSSAFSDIRAEVKARTEGGIARVLADEPSNPGDLGTVPPSRAHSAGPHLLDPPPPAPEVGGSGKYLRPVAVALLGIGVVLGSWWWRPDSRLRTRASEPVTLAAAPRSVQAKPVASVAPPAARPNVLINFHVSPPGADLTVDGHALHPDTTSEIFPVDNEVHLLKVEWPGYPAVTREFLVTHDDTLEVRLSTRGGAGRSSSKAALLAQRLGLARAATPPPAKSASDAPPPKADCASPSYFDPSGIKRYRSDCL